LEQHNVVLSKREAGIWALDILSERWQSTIRAALRAYDGLATSEDVELLAADMTNFVAMIRELMPSSRELSR
jgi:hypothetical protein